MGRNRDRLHPQRLPIGKNQQRPLRGAVQAADGGLRGWPAAVACLPPRPLTSRYFPSAESARKHVRTELSCRTKKGMPLRISQTPPCFYAEPGPASEDRAPRQGN
jgi:hypothetical protein